jgi:ubiquinone/menaquinone biosynthesis C-methylase UbiE
MCCSRRRPERPGSDRVLLDQVRAVSTVADIAAGKRPRDIAMNRRVANIIRFFMDECLPPIIRDNKYFMYPFFYLAYRGRNIRTAMNFKSLIYRLSQREYAEFYDGLNTISRNRKTDLNEASIRLIIEKLHPQAKNLIDIGCGRGYFLNQIKDKSLQLVGFDIVDKGISKNYKYVKGNMEKLPFGDKQFDVVTCSHTLEHILHPENAVSELERITKRQLIVVVPCQRPYYYTLDEHVNFFLYKEQLTSLFSFKTSRCERVWGDWVYMGYPE